jgi:hypothetical protein
MASSTTDMKCVLVWPLRTYLHSSWQYGYSSHNVVMHCSYGIQQAVVHVSKHSMLLSYCSLQLRQ